jgi:hypothetical protein
MPEKRVVRRFFRTRIRLFFRAFSGTKKCPFLHEKITKNH